MGRWSKEFKLVKTRKLEKVRSKVCRKETIGKGSSFDETIGDDFENLLNNSQNNMF